MKIGFFDSGLGGLFILRAVVQKLPSYEYVYYGDTAHLPYGDKTEEEVYELTKAAVEELFARDCALVIIACNTASAETVRRLQETILVGQWADRRILGVIIPTVETIVEKSPQRVVLLATKRTVESGKYERELKKLNFTGHLTALATSELVPLIEAGREDEAARVAIEKLATIVRPGDVVVLGCTHYTLLKTELRTHYSTTVTFLAQDEIIPDKLANYLLRHPEIKNRLTSTGGRSIILTEHRPDYDRVTAEFLGGVYMPGESDVTL